jgi:hypothetical protein
MADQKKHPATDHRHRAAASHRAAAHHHLEAAIHHELGQQEEAKWHATAAHGHSEGGYKCTTDAHGHSHK